MAHYRLTERLEGFRKHVGAGDLFWIKNLPDVALTLLCCLIVEEIDLEARGAAGVDGAGADWKPDSKDWDRACAALEKKDSLVRACCSLGVSLPPRTWPGGAPDVATLSPFRALLFEVALTPVQEFGVYAFNDPVVRLTMLDLDERFRSLKSTPSERKEARRLLRKLFAASLPQRPIDYRSVPASAILESVRDIAKSVRHWDKLTENRAQLLDCLKWEFPGIRGDIWDSVEDLLHFDAGTVALEVVRRDAGYPMSADSLGQLLKPASRSLRTPIWPGMA